MIGLQFRGAKWPLKLRMTMPATLSSSRHVARLTNCRSILPSTTANVPCRNCAIAYRSPMQITAFDGSWSVAIYTQRGDCGSVRVAARIYY